MLYVIVMSKVRAKLDILMNTDAEERVDIRMEIHGRLFSKLFADFYVKC